MAEVPEVEILTRDLRTAVVGRTFRDVIILQKAAVRFPLACEFPTLLKGRTVLDATRRAKYMLMPLSDDLTLS
ncbi:MAG: formamidopyrimidine-DNA glycosylase, partial [Acidobacteriota bacterium]|nr:formamidopyrimidine-DNA glycosylase [Acidobacteriota bacterium]